jgi:hypothetical protein
VREKNSIPISYAKKNKTYFKHSIPVKIGHQTQDSMGRMKKSCEKVSIWSKGNANLHFFLFFKKLIWKNVS